MKLMIAFLLVYSTLSPATANAKLNVLTTTTTLKSIVEAVGGEHVKVDSVTKGPQDPHFVEAKPSYMVKARKADLLVAIGLDLEIGWLPSILRGARNPNIMKGSSGYLDAGSLIHPIEVSKEKVDRSRGDVHVLGNPHFTLDPVRVVNLANGISNKLSQLDPKNENSYKNNAKNFSKKIERRISNWKIRIQKTGIKEVVTYHKSLNYFLQRFGLMLSGSIEPKPGIPPSAKHILSLIGTVKKRNISCILVESFFETNAAERIKRSVPIHIEIVPTEVGATKDAIDYELLIESLVASIEQCQAAQQTKEKS